MKDLYQEVKRRLEKIDFESIWHGFHLYPFALYTQDEAILDECIISTPDCFCGNTTVFYNQRWIAIWNIGLEPFDKLDLLTASLVHEMFHAFQMENKEGRFPNDLTLLSTILTPESLAWKIEERMYLAKEESFFKFFSARSERKKNYPLHEEELLETIEGMAQYVELCALKQLSESLFTRRFTQCQNRLNDPKQAINIRRSGYDSGAMMLWYAKESGLNIYHLINQETRSIFEFLLQQVTDIEDDLSYSEANLKSAIYLLDEQTKKQNSEIEKFMNNSLDKVEGPFRICGYDPMNMFRQQDLFYSRSFIMLKDSNGEMRKIQGEALLNMERDSDNLVLSYFKVRK